MHTSFVTPAHMRPQIAGFNCHFFTSVLAFQCNIPGPELVVVVLLKITIEPLALLIIRIFLLFYPSTYTKALPIIAISQPYGPWLQMTG